MRRAAGEATLRLAGARTGQEQVEALKAEVKSTSLLAERWPQYFESHGACGHASVKLGCLRQALGQDPMPDFEVAERCFAEAARLNPRAISGLANVRHNMLQIRVRRRTAKAEDFDSILSLWTKMIEIDPSGGDSWCERGAVYLTRAEWRTLGREDPQPDCDLAIADFERAIRVDRGLSEPHVRMGTANEFVGDYWRANGESPAASYRRALEAYGRAREIAPDLAPAVHGIERVRAKMVE
jgi:tetratricopeptide (TPR) repeat protein